MNRCAICGGTSGQVVHTREMLHGFRDPFEYFECVTCGCVQLITPPAEMGKFYPRDYYSFAKPSLPNLPPVPKGRLRRWIYEKRNEAQVLKSGGLWGMIAAKRPRPDIRPDFIDPSIRNVSGINLRSRVLDVGCGAGRLLLNMRQVGFVNLTGIDPFLVDSISEPCPGVKILAQDIERHDGGPYDLIMMHHSLEHMHNQFDSMKSARRLLSARGTLLIRIPCVSSRPWKLYRADWVNLDPPRHYYLHSHDSLRRLASSTGFKVSRLICDSNAFSYAGSELYKRDTPINRGSDGGYVNFDHELGKEVVADFQRQAEQDNIKLEGDCIAAYLEPV